MHNRNSSVNLIKPQKNLKQIIHLNQYLEITNQKQLINMINVKPAGCKKKIIKLNYHVSNTT